MRVLAVGILPPPGEDAAFRFGRYVARLDLAGDVVTTHSPHALSVAHKNVRLRARTLPRHLRSESENFEAVVLRVGATLPFGPRRPLLGRRHRVRALVSAVAGYAELSLYVDPGVAAIDELFRAEVRPFWASASQIIVANDADLAAVLERGEATPGSVVIEEPGSSPGDTAAPWPSATTPSLSTSVAGVVRERSYSLSRSSILLASATGTARPSLVGASVWLARRVVGKSRGWVTKLLRP